MNPEERERNIVFEICNKGNLMDFVETVTRLVQRIRQSEGRVVCSDACAGNIFQPAHLYGDRNLIVLGFRFQRTNRMHTIWDILYLTGHHLSGPPRPGELPLDRELRAWEIAMKEWKEYPELHPHGAAFIGYKADCLQPYRDNWQWGKWNGMMN